MIPGLRQFPDLAAQYELKLNHLRNAPGCKQCAIRKLNTKYRQILDRRLKRDKGV